MSEKSPTMTSRYDEIMKTKPYLPFKMGYLTEDMVVKAEKDLGETEEVKAKCIPELRKMVEKETKLVSPTDDAYLLQYLRARKYNVKRAFSLMQGYYNVKKSFPEFYGSFHLDAAKRAFASKVLMCLPYRDEDGSVTFLIKFANWDTDVISLAEGIQAMTMVILHAVEDPATQVCGMQLLVDVRGVSLKHMRQITPRFMYLFSRALRNTLAARYKGVHIFNESAIFQYMWSVLRLFFSEKINKRIHFHGDCQKSLHKFIPKAILPVEYGGDNPNDIADWYNSEMVKYFDRAAELTTYGYRD